jgi:hypothetical protein
MPRSSGNRISLQQPPREWRQHCGRQLDTTVSFTLSSQDAVPFERARLWVWRSTSTSATTAARFMKAKRCVIQNFLKTQNGERDVDLCSELSALLREYVGNRTAGLVFCDADGDQISQRDILKYSLHPILKNWDMSGVDSTSSDASGSPNSRKRIARRRSSTSGPDTRRRTSPSATKSCSRNVITGSSGPKKSGCGLSCQSAQLAYLAYSSHLGGLAKCCLL